VQFWETITASTNTPRYFCSPGNNVKMGIVGIPNVGKSTFFNCLTKLNIPAENFPFCTIEPNQATVPVPVGKKSRINCRVDPFTYFDGLSANTTNRTSASIGL
jgi:hypothetical protein